MDDCQLSIITYKEYRNNVVKSGIKFQTISSLFFIFVEKRYVNMRKVSRGSFRRHDSLQTTSDKLVEICFKPLRD